MGTDLLDPYLHPGTDVLRNIHGFTSADVLKTFEYEQSKYRAEELREAAVPGRFDLKHLQAIHRHLFQDVYPWAGQVRTVNLSKGGSSFARTSRIEAEAQRIAGALAAENYLQGLDKPAFVRRLAHFYAELNALHPFREGNGRSTRELLGQLAREAGYELDQTRIDNAKGQWDLAAKRSFAGDLGPVTSILANAIRPSRAVSFEHHDQADALAKHPELRGAYAGLGAMQDGIALRYPGNEKAQAYYLAHARSEVVRLLDTGRIPPAPNVELQIVRGGYQHAAHQSARSIDTGVSR